MVIALVMLLILTLLATASARMTLLDERMTGNTQDRNMAFQAAEAAIRDRRDETQVPVLPDFDGTNGLWQPAAPDDDPVWESVDWDGRRQRCPRLRRHWPTPRATWLTPRRAITSRRCRACARRARAMAADASVLTRRPSTA